VARFYHYRLKKEGVYRPAGAAASIDYEQSTKNDAEKAPIVEPAGHVSTTALGRSLGKARIHKATRRNHYTVDKEHFAQKCLHYREGHTLRCLGLDVPTRSAAAAAPDTKSEGAQPDDKAKVKKRPRTEEKEVETVDITV